MGITVCIASGDHGTANEDALHWDGQIHVDHPAADPLVLGCGGTQIVNKEDVVWNEVAVDGSWWSSGGGISTKFPVPDYQVDSSLPVSIATSQHGRGVPDVAMSATNYFTRVDTSEGPSGGTSTVAPLMAALVVRLNQAKKRNVGFLNPFLYAHALDGISHAVINGNNGNADSPLGYPAGPGWNACTGLGVPNGQAILDSPFLNNK